MLNKQMLKEHSAKFEHPHLVQELSHWLVTLGYLTQTNQNMKKRRGKTGFITFQVSEDK